MIRRIRRKGYEIIKNFDDPKHVKLVGNTFNTLLFGTNLRMAGLGSMLPLPCLSGTLGDATDVKAREERRYQKLKSKWVKRLNNHRSIGTAKIYEGGKIPKSQNPKSKEYFLL